VNGAAPQMNFLTLRPHARRGARPAERRGGYGLCPRIRAKTFDSTQRRSKAFESECPRFVLKQPVGSIMISYL
jgi:hypothetical protein